MGLLKQMRQARFWKGWKDRFRDERDRFITPTNPAVIEASAQAQQGASTDKEVALNAWKYIYDNTEYILGKEWKTPQQTLREKTGDCEDVTFLIASMLKYMGVNNVKIGIGELIFPDGEVELHTWVEVKEKVIDATGEPSLAAEVTYKPVKKYAV